MKLHRMLGLLYACALCATVARGETIHVSPWDSTSIQAGIDAASAGDTVMLAWGVYTETGIQMKSGVHLTSETGLPESVTIDGTGLGTVLLCDGVDSTAVVSGLTITGGHAIVAGGGIHAYQSSLLFEDVRVVGNYAYQWGGGMRCSACPGLRMNRVAFVSNSSSSGGGLYCSTSRPQLTDVVFAGNMAVCDGGGAVFNYRGGATLVQCEFTGNSAERGGGAFCTLGVSPKLFDVVFSGNSAIQGGGIACVEGSWPEVTGGTFSENTASNGGGAVYCTDSHPALVDVEFLENTAQFNGGALYAGGDWTGCIAGQSGVGGNISAAPLFCNPEVGDFALRADSPCAPEANPSCGLIGAWDVACEVTAVRPTTWGRVKAAYR